jgi:hypothetical protein
VWRRQLLALLALGVITGLGGGIALVALQGARRADSAYDRLLERTLAPDAISTVDEELFERLTALPEVAAAARFSYTPVAPEPLVPGVDGGAFVAMDEGWLTTVYRPAILEGRELRESATDEVLINEALADRADLGPGDRVLLRSGFEDPVALGEVTIAGVARGQFDVGANAGNPSVLLPYALFDAHREDLIVLPDAPALFRLEPGTRWEAFEAKATELAGREVGFLRAGQEGEGINRSLRIQSLAYAALAVSAAVATVVVVAQGISRQVRSGLATELRVLVAIGLTPRQRHPLALVLVVPVIAVGVVMAIAVGVLASPLVPTGLAREVDLDSGIRIDAPLLAAGALALVVVLGLCAVAIAWRIHVSDPPRSAPPSRTSRALRRLPTRARLGAELALAPRSAPAGPAARSALVGTFLATAAVLGVGVFTASLDRLLDPSHVDLSGWDFNLAVSVPEGSDGATFDEDLSEVLEGAPPDAMSGVHIIFLTVDGEAVETLAFDPSDHPVHPTMRTGRAPQSTGEIVLGADVADRLEVGVGDDVVVAAARERRVEVVGIASYPEIGNNGDIGNAGSITRELATELGAEDVVRGVLLRYEGGPDPATVGALSEIGEVVEPFLGPRVARLEQVRGIPRVLAAFLVVLGAAAVAHGLHRATRDRRRDLAVLRCVGFSPRDVRLVVACQGVVTGLVGGALGLIGGLAVGPWVWERVADGVAAVPSVAVPMLLFVALVPATVVLSLAAASWPAWRASRRPVVDGLVAEDAWT